MPSLDKQACTYETGVRDQPAHYTFPQNAKCLFASSSPNHHPYISSKPPQCSLFPCKDTCHLQSTRPLKILYTTMPEPTTPNLPDTALNVPPHPCRTCGPIPLFSLTQVRAEYEAEALRMAPQNSPPTALISALLPVTVAEALSRDPPRYNTAALIRANFKTIGGVGYLHGPDGHEKIPMYKCGGCRPLFALPADAVDVARRTNRAVREVD